MMNDWKQRILTGWSLMRFLRLGLALIVISEAYQNSELLFALLGGILFLQALLNVGCCGAAGCDISHKPSREKSSNNLIEDVTFKEVK